MHLIKDGLASADQQENLNVIVMVFFFHKSDLYLRIRLDGIFLVLILLLQVLS